MGGEASAIASLLDLRGYTFRMLVPALLVLFFCLKGHAGTASGRGGGKYGGGWFDSCCFTGVNGAEGSDSWI